MTDVRQDVKTVRINIESTIQTFGTGYEIGPNLRKCSNLVHNWMTKDGITKSPFDYPELPFSYDVPFNPPAVSANGVGYWYGSPGNSDFYVGAIDPTNDKREIYNLNTGDALVQSGVSLGAGAPDTPFSFAYAGNLSQPTTFVCAAQGYLKGRIIDNFGARIVTSYVPQPFDPDGSTPNFETSPRIVYYHLARVWLSYWSQISRRSLIFYSDPFNPTLIRGTNYVDVPDLCNVIFRTSASDLDISSTPHLFFGCLSSIWILDGDPNRGNAFFRELRRDFGIRNAKHQVEVTGGSVFLATNNRLYILPSGSFDPVVISNGLRQKFDSLDRYLHLGWRNPYLYVFDPVNSVCWICDFTNFPQTLNWSGPHTNASQAGQAMGMVTDYPATANIYVPLTRDKTGPCILGTLNQDSSTREMPIFETGYIYEPDADVGVKRVRFKIRQTLNEQTFTLRVTNNQGLGDTRSFILEASISPNNDTISHILVVFDPDRISIGKFFFLELISDTLINILDWQVEYRVVPRKD